MEGQIDRSECEVTRILEALSRGERPSISELLPLGDNEMRRWVAQRLARETPGQTLQATALAEGNKCRGGGIEPRRYFPGASVDPIAARTLGKGDEM